MDGPLCYHKPFNKYIEAHSHIMFFTAVEQQLRWDDGYWTLRQKLHILQNTGVYFENTGVFSKIHLKVDFGEPPGQCFWQLLKRSMYVCIYVCVYVDTLCSYAYMFVCVYMYDCMYLWLYACTYVCACLILIPFATIQMNINL